MGSLNAEDAVAGYEAARTPDCRRIVPAGDGGVVPAYHRTRGEEWW
jgi:hypothetical protein